MLEQHKTPLLYDTTLRDGAQAAGANISLNDKLNIVRMLVDFGIPYIEAGWPGSNPKDKDLFKKLESLNCKNSKLVAFGSTRKARTSAANDPQLRALIEANTPTITLVAKTWDFHVTEIIGTSLAQNIAMIRESIEFCKQFDREVILDAEHFFDGFQNNPDYALSCLHAAVQAGVDMITLCDTNGGFLPEQIGRICAIVGGGTKVPLGVHCHNDCELAVANSLAAWKAGVQLIQGTFNGYGERCGNANLSSLIPILQLKYGQSVVPVNKLRSLTTLSKQLSNYFNLPLNPFAAFVGHSAFAHKGGLHVSAINKKTNSYEHVSPETIGNDRRILISELAGKANIRSQLDNFELSAENLDQLVNKVKSLDKEGIDLEEADGSFVLLVLRNEKQYRAPFELIDVKSHMNPQSHQKDCQGIIKLQIDDEVFHTISEGDGPVEALDQALRLALSGKYPEVSELKLIDYKVRIVDPDKAASASTRVWIKAAYKDSTWSTVGFSRNIISASMQALTDCFEYFLLMHLENRSKHNDHKAA